MSSILTPGSDTGSDTGEPGMFNPIRALLIAIATGAAPCVALQPVALRTVLAAPEVAAPGTGGRRRGLRGQRWRQQFAA